MRKASAPAAEKKTRRTSRGDSFSERNSAIAFPAISSGVFGYPTAGAAAVASKAIEEFLSENESPREVRLVFFSPAGAEEFLKNHKFER